MYYTYILRCEGGSLYAGITTDLVRRFSEHAKQGGKGAKYTALRKPVRFEGVWESPGRSEALKLEHRLRTLTKLEKERLICGEIPEKIDFSAYVRVQITENGEMIL